MLLPEAGDRGDQDSELEDVLEDGEEVYEPAGELRIENSDSRCRRGTWSLPRKRVDKSKWIKNGTSDKTIKSGESNLSRNLIDELDSSALTIGSKIFSHDIVMILVHQTNLYANRDKKWKKLKLMSKKWRDFLAFFWYLDIIHCLMKITIGQLNKILVFQLSTMQWVETGFKKIKNISTVRTIKISYHTE